MRPFYQHVEDQNSMIVLVSWVGRNTQNFGLRRTAWWGGLGWLGAFRLMPRLPGSLHATEGL